MGRALLNLMCAFAVIGAAFATAECSAAQTTKPNTGASKGEKGDKLEAREEAPVWMADLSKVTVPQKPAIGKLHGETFTLDRAELQGGTLSLRQGREFFADLEFK